jgi:hypothetical protein
VWPRFDGYDAGAVRSSVSIRRADGREQTFRIVGEDEVDPSRGTISHVSPLAKYPAQLVDHRHRAVDHAFEYERSVRALHLRS